MSAPDLNDVAMFVRVMRRGGFAPAARELGVPTSTVSRAVARLEERIGARLLQRTTRALRPTAEGRDYFSEAAPALAALEEATRSAVAPDQVPRGRLRVIAPTDFGGFMAELVSRFTTKHPEVSVEIEFTSRNADLVAEGIDVAIRNGTLQDSSLVARRIGQTEAIVVASPSYLEKRGTPRVPADLAKHEALLLKGREGQATWTLENGKQEVRVEVAGRITASDSSFLRNAAVAGAGLALLPRVMCSADVESNRLVQVLPGWTATGLSAWLVYPSAKHVPAKVAAFRDLLFETHKNCEVETKRRVPART